jgi:hypothetical protein
VRIGLLLVEDRGGWGRVRESYDMDPPLVKNVIRVHAYERGSQPALRFRTGDSHVHPAYLDA